MDRGNTPQNNIGGKDNLWDVLSHKVDDEAATERAGSVLGNNDDYQNMNEKSISLKSIRLPPIRRRNMDGKLLGGEGGPNDLDVIKKDISQTQTKGNRLPLLGRPETYISDMRDKLRELEVNMIDIKAGFERKLNQILEEIPSKMTRELKSIEERDNFQWRDTKNKIGSQEKLVSSLKQTLDKTVFGLVKKVDSMATQVEANKFKLTSLSSAVDAKMEAMTSTHRRSDQDDARKGVVDVEIGTDVRHLKEQLQSERMKREQDFEESQKLFYQLQQKMHSQEKEILDRLKEHRDYQLEMFRAGEEERAKIHSLKEDKEDGNTEYLK